MRKITAYWSGSIVGGNGAAKRRVSCCACGEKCSELIGLNDNNPVCKKGHSEFTEQESKEILKIGLAPQLAAAPS